MNIVGSEIEQAHILLQAPELQEIQGDPDLDFLNKRVERAMVLKKRVEKVVDNPIVKLMGVVVIHHQQLMNFVIGISAMKQQNLWPAI